MRAVFAVVGLLVALAVVGLLARKQLGSVTAPAVPAAGAEAGAQPATATPTQQVRQFKQAVEGSLQQARPMPDDSQ